MVASVFVAYAYLSPTRYETSAVIEAGPPDAALPSVPPLEAARRLHEAILDSQTLRQLTREVDPAGSVEAARRFREALHVNTLDGRVFSIGFTDSKPERTQRLCNVLAKRGAERAPSALAAARGALSREGNSPEGRLAEFLAAHPDIGAPSASATANNANAAARSSARRAP
ncbi:MAG: hypothetical protein QM756_37525 [Polyangiaceae bacterium]